MNVLLLAALPNPNNMPPALAAVLVVGWFLFVTVAVMYTLSRMSGWVLLARRFAANGNFAGETWSWQSARLRGWCNYNNCLCVGADPMGLYLAVMAPFRLFHPPLYIPWTEIDAQTGKAFLGFYDTVQLRIGREEQVSVRFYGKMVDRLRQASGSGWPNYAAEQMTAQFKSTKGF
ncbi:MAG: hypothetical protein P4M01_06995 [Acidobacteriota bacterium]|nr:hypothetical protein [Acidobacteriota bacterium]